MRTIEMIGQKDTLDHLLQNINCGRKPHAQIFEGKSGYGGLPLALMYARALVEISSQNTQKIDPINHPDIHFFFPVVNRGGSSSPSTSKDFLPEWSAFLNQSLYGTLNDWYDHIDAGNKQGIITANEAQNIVKTLSLKSFSGGHKVLIIWQADKMNTSCANKLLKWVEEPNKKTSIILISENIDLLLSTIRSRCQLLTLNRITTEDIERALIKKGIDPENAKMIASCSEGDFNKAIRLAKKNNKNEGFEKLFIDWVRIAFRAKSSKDSISQLLDWCDKISRLGREAEKQFLEYSLEFFRQALVLNYGMPELVTNNTLDKSFSLKKFSAFVGGRNIESIYEEVERAIFHIEKNGNSKIVFTDLSIKLTRLLHTKTQQ